MVEIHKEGNQRTFAVAFSILFCFVFFKVFDIMT